MSGDMMKSDFRPKTRIKEVILYPEIAPYPEESKSFTEIFEEHYPNIPAEDVISIQYRCGYKYAHWLVWYRE